MAKRRGQGEGSIYKRKDGLWVAQIPINGKRLYKYSKTQREARDWLQETRNQVSDGLTHFAAKITLKQYLIEWLSYHKTSVRPNTIQQYKGVVIRHIIPTCIKRSKPNTLNGVSRTG